MSAGACSLCGCALGECECGDNLLSLAESAFRARAAGDTAGQIYYERQQMKYHARFSLTEFNAIIDKARKRTRKYSPAVGPY